MKKTVIPPTQQTTVRVGGKINRSVSGVLLEGNFRNQTTNAFVGEINKDPLDYKFTKKIVR